MTRGAVITAGALAALVASAGAACGDESSDAAAGSRPTGTTTTQSTSGPGGGTTSSSGVAGEGTGGSGAGAGSQPSGGAGGAFDCEDDGPGEPNDAPEEAVNLVVISDNDPATPYLISGVLRGSSDVDWYTYLGVDETGGYVDPEQTITLGASEVQLCAYYWCVDPTVWQSPGIGDDASLGSHECPAGTVEDEVDLSDLEHGNASLGVTAGCCTEPGTTTMHLGEDLYSTFHPFDCPGSGTNDGMKVFLRVSAREGSEPELCQPYRVAHHF